MGPRRRLIAGLAVAAACGAAWLGLPRRFEVEGVSMGPGLLPGDVVRTAPFPLLDRLRRPRRFDRWVLAAADGFAVKRVIGLPGEGVAIAEGDLVVAGAPILKGPRLLAEMASVVPDDPAGSPPVEAGWSWSRPAGTVLDDAAFDEGATRVLAAVRDVGLVALVDVGDASAADPAEIRVRVAGTVVSRPLATAGRHAVVAGRLDGRLVVATWPVAGEAALDGRRGCLPAGAPRAWPVAPPWPEPAGDDAAPALAIDTGDRGTIVDVGRWRDVAWRPGVDGRTSWSLGGAEILVLGDHPAASTDSRRWGPVETDALRHRVAAAWQ